MIYFEHASWCNVVHHLLEMLINQWHYTMIHIRVMQEENDEYKKERSYEIPQLEVIMLVKCEMQSIHSAAKVSPAPGCSRWTVFSYHSGHLYSVEYRIQVTNASLATEQVSVWVTRKHSVVIPDTRIQLATTHFILAPHCILMVRIHCGGN